MACCIAGIALDRDKTAGIQPAYISRSGFINDDFRTRQTHRAYTLTSISYMEMKGLALRAPERTANIMLAGSRYLKFSFPILHCLADCEQQILGGHAVMSF